MMFKKKMLSAIVSQTFTLTFLVPVFLSIPAVACPFLEQVGGETPKSTSVDTGRPLIVAHRGASKDAPENTIPAFNLAWAQGADAIEVDCHLTKDGHIVCIHDANTQKVAGTKLVVSQSSLTELRILDVGKNHGDRFKGTVIPTLGEVLATVPDRKKIYIEIKSDASIVPLLFKEIEKSGIQQDQIVVISFNQKVIQAVETKAPHYKTYWLASFKKDKSGKIAPSSGAVLQTLKSISADGVSTNSALLTKDLINDIRQQGYEYHVWTIDDPKAAQRLTEWGAQSITTNLPGKIRKQLVP